jgi:hypothetical protein
VRLIDPRTPLDVRNALQDNGNIFNGIGSKVSFVELYELAIQVEKLWQDGMCQADANVHVRIVPRARPLREHNLSAP